MPRALFSFVHSCLWTVSLDIGVFVSIDVLLYTAILQVISFGTGSFKIVSFDAQNLVVPYLMKLTVVRETGRGTNLQVLSVQVVCFWEAHSLWMFYVKLLHLVKGTEEMFVSNWAY